MNLTQRFSLTHGFIALLAVAITLVVIIGAAHHFFEGQIHESQNSQMKAFELAAKEAYFTNDDVAVLDFIRLAAKDPLVVFAASVDGNGKTRVLPMAFRGMDLSKTGSALPDGRCIKVLSSTLKDGDKAVETIMLAYDAGKIEAQIRAQTNRWVGMASLAGACALAIAFGLSILLSKTLVGPLKHIKAGTELVQAGKLDKLVEVNRSDEIGALARSFNHMIIQLKELEGMKRDFITGVTHDFGTPLHAIKNAVELLQEGIFGPLTPEQTDNLLMISNNLNHLTAFIKNLLTTARIEAAKVEPFFETVDSLAISREIVALYQPEADKKGVELKLLNEEPSLALVTDATMFRQVLTNLLSNAMKYTPEGGVFIRLSQGNGIATLQVSDTGVGIDPKYHQLIFDKFFRVRQSKNFPPQNGSGLGLSIAKGLAEAMGGSILVESQVGKGSIFTVKLAQRHPAFSMNPLPPTKPAFNDGPKPAKKNNPPAPKNLAFKKKLRKNGRLPKTIPGWLIHNKER